MAEPILILLALLLFIGGGTALFHRSFTVASSLERLRDASSAKCVRCGYDLQGLPAKTRCPECGNRKPRSLRSEDAKAALRIVHWVIGVAALVPAVSLVVAERGGGRVNAEIYLMVLVLAACSAPFWFSIYTFLGYFAPFVRRRGALVLSLIACVPSAAVPSVILSIFPPTRTLGGVMLTMLCAVPLLGFGFAALAYGMRWRISARGGYHAK